MLQPILLISGVKKSAAATADNMIKHMVYNSKDEPPKEKQQMMIETSGFSTKDSSDSKSHDSGIDSIEKPGIFAAQDSMQKAAASKSQVKAVLL